MNQNQCNSCYKRHMWVSLPRAWTRCGEEPVDLSTILSNHRFVQGFRRERCQAELVEA